MKIIDVLKLDEPHTRVSMGTCWMVWDHYTEEWTVYQRKAYAKRSTELYRGTSESDACNTMIKEW